MNLALFDLDHTLLPLDSDNAWHEFIIDWRGLSAAERAEQSHRRERFYDEYLRGTLNIHDFIFFATESLRLLGLAASLRAREEFMRRVIAPAITPAALGLVQRHLQAGDRCALVTATNDFVAQPIAEAFGLSDWLATQLQRDAAGNITGTIDGVPCFREGKVQRVQDWLAAQGRDIASFAQSFFYGDSPNDVPIMERVSHPVAANPAPELAALAQERGWPRLDLFAQRP